VTHLFDPESLNVERVRRCACAAILLEGEESVALRLNDTLYRFPPTTEGHAAAKSLADGIYEAVLRVEAASQ